MTARSAQLDPSAMAAFVAESARQAYGAANGTLASLCPQRPSRGVRVNPGHQEDLEMVRRSLRGDRDAQSQLAGRLQCVGRMLMARNRQLGSFLNAAELEDVTQDVVVRVLDKRAAYSGLGAIETWVYVFCEGELRNAIRRKQRRTRRQAETQSGVGDLATALVPGPDEDVHLCVDALPMSEQQLVRWKYFEEMTMDAISARTGAKLNTVKSRCFRVLEQLRRCLEARARKG